MFIIGYFLLALARIIHAILILYMLLMFVRAVFSWVRVNPENRLVRLVYVLTEPVLFQIRKRLPVVYRGFDFSPVIVVLALIFLREFLVRVLYALAKVML